MSNEKSANEGNTVLDGIEINHQRSKSLDFELAFAEYLQHAITSDVKYFSLLRGMYEIKIAEIFAKYPPYFDVFSSCNTNFKILEESLTKIGLKAQNNFRRCNNCPKCAFVYTILRPFVTDDQVKIIWGEELYEKESLLTTFKELLGITGMKPFECVGTNEEVVMGMKKSLDMKKGPLPVVLEMFGREIATQMKHKDWVALEKKLFTITDE
jgi:UDP-N-acetyl-alpha-D-muramoyl-L-alanyl-L-glutamate epimerase